MVGELYKLYSVQRKETLWSEWRLFRTYNWSGNKVIHGGQASANGGM